MGATESSAASAARGAAQVRTRRKPPYLCFLVRCRLEEGAGREGEPAWRFTVEQVGPGAPRRCFACLSDVGAYLEAELEWSARQMGGPIA